MKINITARHFKLTDAISNHVKERLDKVQLLCKDEIKAHVTLGIEKYLHRAEITLSGRNIQNNANVTEKNMYAAIDEAIKVITQQIIKHNKKNMDLRLRKGEKINESLRFS